MTSCYSYPGSSRWNPRWLPNPTHHCGAIFFRQWPFQERRVWRAEKFVQTSSSSICRFWTNYGLKVHQQVRKSTFWNEVTTLQVGGVVSGGNGERLLSFGAPSGKTSSFLALVNIKSRGTCMQLRLLMQWRYNAGFFDLIYYFSCIYILSPFNLWLWNKISVFFSWRK